MLFARQTSTIGAATGDGTAYQYIYDTADVNVGGCYNTGSGVLTIPSTSIYLFQAGIFLQNLGAAHTALSLYLSGLFNTNYTYSNPFSLCVGGTYAQQYSLIAGPSTPIIPAGSTITNNISVTGGTKTIDLYGVAACYTYWACYKVT